MTPEEIKTAERKFIEAAVRCKKTGYDGVELHGAHSYLIGQFFSPYYNKRTDSYGGSFKNRMRFISEIIDGIRTALGGDYPLSVRICGDEMTPDVPDTLSLSDGLAIGEYLQSRLTGLEAADLLTERGVKITLVEMQNEAGPGLFSVIKSDIMGRIGKISPKIMTGHRLISVEKGAGALKACLRDEAGGETSVEADYIVLAIGASPDTKTVEAFESEFGQNRVFAIGSAARQGRIYEAIRDGFDRAFSFVPRG
jgi:2,4-dienoyl-CoA reductase-like NADH-dependent reductase (Old Yellow Enzyme family)